MSVLPDGFIHVLTNPDGGPQLFSPEHQPVIDHLLAGSRDFKFTESLRQVDDLFGDCWLPAYGPDKKDQYFGQWHNFLFSIVIAVYYHSLSPLVAAAEGGITPIEDWRKRVKKAAELAEQIEIHADKLYSLLRELSVTTEKCDLRPLPRLGEHIHSVFELGCDAQDYEPYGADYLFQPIPCRITKCSSFLRAFFSRVNDHIRMRHFNPRLEKLSNELWADLLTYSSGLIITADNVKFTKNKTPA